jgi:hypothetical protein
MSHNLMGLHGLLQGWLYLFTFYLCLFLVKKSISFLKFDKNIPVMETMMHTFHN